MSGCVDKSEFVIKNEQSTENTTKYEYFSTDTLSVDKIKSESFSALCLCCLGETGLKCIYSTHYFQDELEVYSNMIESCFNLEIPADDSLSKEVYQICGDCVTRLRDAYYFRYQILKSLQQLRDRLAQLKDEDYLDASDKSPVAEYLEDGVLSHESNSTSFELPQQQKVKKKSREKPVKSRSKTKINKKSAEYKDIPKNNKNTKEKKHLTDVLKKKKDSEKLPYVLEKGSLICHICDETFPLHSTLVRHMPIHFPNHICHICAKVFASKTQLSKHISLHQAKEYKCDICGKSYRGLDNLRSHKQRHSKFNFYKCLHCPQRFQAYHTRLKHLVEVHNEEPKKYKCKQCSKSYMQGGALTRHIKRVHLQQRPNPCSVCGDGFFTKTELSDHMRKHTGVRNFKCPVCLKCYGRKYTLTEHMKIHNNDKRFVCPFCGRAFTQKCTLKGHLKTHEKSVTKTDDTGSNATMI